MNVIRIAGIPVRALAFLFFGSILVGASFLDASILKCLNWTVIKNKVLGVTA